MKGKLLVDFNSKDISIPKGTEVNILEANVHLEGKMCTFFEYSNMICITNAKDIELPIMVDTGVPNKLMCRIEDLKLKEEKEGRYTEESKLIKYAALKEWI